METKNKTQQVLEFIAASPEGRRFTEIQQFAWNLTYPGKPFNETVTTSYTSPYDGKTTTWVQKRAHRGWWCTRLLGGMHYAHRPILHTYCTKVAGLWVRNEVAYIPGGRQQ